MSHKNYQDEFCHEHHHHEHHHECCGCHEGCGCSHEHGKNHFLLLIIRVVLSILLLFVSTLLSDVLKGILLVSAYIIISYDVLWNAFKNIIKGKAFDENFLMSIASLTALIVPFFTSNAHIDQYDGILVMILYQIGEFIQHKAVDKSKKSITEMLDFDVSSVTIINNGIEEEIDVRNIKLNDIIVVKPGDLLVVDGIIVSGSSSLNTSSLTGESMPRNVYVGDSVLSGSINNDGLIYLKATSTFNNSTTAKVKEIVEKANKNKAKIDRFFTRFAKVYTPVVIFISLIIMFILPLLLGFEEHFLPYLYKGLAVMVISCPCALVISIPLAYFMGIGKAAKNQVLVKGSSYLEILSEIDVILFDKTGTLTKGEFVINKIESSNINLMINLVYSIEKNFTHAIALSLINNLKPKAKELEISDLVNIPGYGVKAIYDGKNVLIGNAKLLNENHISFNEIACISTIVYVAFNGEYLGYILLEDELKKDAAETINELLKSFEIHIISGDKKEIVAKISDKLNISNYHYELLPQEKLEVLENIKNNKEVIYVGDGINDAACLVSATVGVAMRSIGSDIAINASDVVLMNDNLDCVLKAIKISKKTKRIVTQNIIFSLSVKLIVMALAIFVGVPMYVAIIADVGVAMIAVLNALRIMYTKI